MDAPAGAGEGGMTERDVLIVDDDPDMRETMQLVLEHDGYPCRMASNGVEALEQAAITPPGVVLLDMLMPVMNGPDTAHELRERYGRTVWIIAVTASEHAGKRATDIGADAVLAKPFDIAELRRLISHYLGAKPGPEFS
jgi:CheY-like chemotaxis protein